MTQDIDIEEATAVKGNYNAEQIHVLEGLEAVRKRPAMYIGSTSSRGLHHLVYEVVDNSIDEALAGYCSDIKVIIHKDNSITVIDNGRGIPVDMMKKEKKPAVEVIMTVLHAGGKFGDGAYKVSGGLHGVGVTCVNALSEHMEVEVRRGGKCYGIEFAKGKTSKKLYEKGDCETTGTTVHFKPDATIFTETEYSYDTLRLRIRELAFLNKGITISLTDERAEDKSETFHFAGGIIEYVEFMDKDKDKINPKPIYLEGEKNAVIVEVAMQYCDTYSENIFTYVNNINTEEGGTHLSGFRKALTRTINAYARKTNMLKENEDALSGDDVREGLTAVLSLKVQNPQFESQTKSWATARLCLSLITWSAILWPSLWRKIRRLPKSWWKRLLLLHAPVWQHARHVSLPAVRTLWILADFPASWLTARAVTLRIPRFIWSKVIPQAAAPSRDVTVTSRLFCRCAVKSLMLKRHVLIRC